MTGQKSGTYWQILRGEQNPLRLAEAFRACADDDIAWALDQARCLYLNTDPRSPLAAAIREFCVSVADSPSSNLDTRTRLDALWVVADGAALHFATQIGEKMITLLAAMAVMQPQEAMGCAAALKSRPGHPMLVQALAGFMIDHAGPDDSALLLGLVRTGAMEQFTGEQKDRLLRCVGRIAYNKPYDAMRILDEICREGVRLTTTQESLIGQMLRALHSSPEALLTLLEQEYGEDKDMAALRRALRESAGMPTKPVARLH